MDNLDPSEFLDRHADKLREKAFTLTRQDMKDDWCWVDVLSDLGVIRIDHSRFAWRIDLGLDAENEAKMAGVRSILVKPGNGAYLSLNRVKPEVWERIASVLGDPYAHALPVTLVHEPNLAESVVDALLNDRLLEDDLDPKAEVDSYILAREHVEQVLRELGLKFHWEHISVHFSILDVRAPVSLDVTGALERAGVPPDDTVVVERGNVRKRLRCTYKPANLRNFVVVPIK